MLCSLKYVIVCGHAAEQTVGYYKKDSVDIALTPIT